MPTDRIFLNLFKPLFFLFLFFSINVFPENKMRKRRLLWLIKKLVIIPFSIFLAISGLVFFRYMHNFQEARKNIRVTWITSAQVLMVIESLFIFYKRSTIPKTVLALQRYLQPISKLILNISKNKLRITTLVVCAIVILKHILVSQLLWITLLPVLKRRKFSTFAIFVFNIVCLIVELGFTLIDCYLIYYCVLCWILKRAFQVYRLLLDGNCLDEHHVVSYYSRISKALEHVNADTSVHVFWIFAYVLLQFFCQTFMVLRYSTNRFEVTVTAWSAMALMFTVISAASVGEADQLVKEYFSKCNLEFSNEFYFRLTAKMTLDENHLSIWNMFLLKRVTIINIVGVFITYAVILI